MKSQTREKNDPHELNNPIPYSVSAIILGLTLWAVSYVYWTANEVEEIKKAAKMQQLEAIQAQATSEPVAVTAKAETVVVTAKKSVKAINAKAIYNSNCAACHQASGQGLPGVFPPLAQSSWVTSKNEDLPIQIISKGLMGSISVKDTSYNGVMPAFSASLSADELAALITYLRQSWGNNASSISAERVQQSMEKYSSQNSPWSGESQLIETIGSAK